MENLNLPLTRDLGCTTNAEVIQRFVSLKGKHVVDAGCGSMAFTRIPAGAGANVLAIDPDPVQAELNRAETLPGIAFAETGAEQIPAEDNSVDCPLNQVMKRFHDEDIERAAAWISLETIAIPMFGMKTSKLHSSNMARRISDSNRRKT